MRIRLCIVYLPSFLNGVLRSKIFVSLGNRQPHIIQLIMGDMGEQEQLVNVFF